MAGTDIGRLGKDSGGSERLDGMIDGSGTEGTVIDDMSGRVKAGTEGEGMAGVGREKLVMSMDVIAIDGTVKVGRDGKAIDVNSIEGIGRDKLENVNEGICKDGTGREGISEVGSAGTDTERGVIEGKSRLRVGNDRLGTSPEDSSTDGSGISSEIPGGNETETSEGMLAELSREWYRRKGHRRQRYASQFRGQSQRDRWQIVKGRRNNTSSEKIVGQSHGGDRILIGSNKVLRNAVLQLASSSAYSVRAASIGEAGAEQSAEDCGGLIADGEAVIE
jgi:hypothetical protein